MSITALTDLDHLRAVFGTVQLVERREDHTDTWNCPICREPITEVYDCRTLRALLGAIAARRCDGCQLRHADPQHTLLHE